MGYCFGTRIELRRKLKVGFTAIYHGKCSDVKVFPLPQELFSCGQRWFMSELFETVYERARYIAVITNGLEFRCVGIKPRRRVFIPLIYNEQRHNKDDENYKEVCTCINRCFLNKKASTNGCLCNWSKVIACSFYRTWRRCFTRVLTT